MYKNLSEIISKDSWQMTVIQNRVVVLEKHFFLVVNRREHFFRAQYFRKVVAVNHSSIDTLFLRRALATINCIYKMNLTVYLRQIFISKEHLKPYIWVAPSFFSGGLLQWSSVFNGSVFLLNKNLQSSLF